MTRGHVPNLVGHHPCQLGFVIGRQEQSLVHIEKTTGQGKRINFVGIDYFDCEGHLGVRVQHDILADAVYVFRNYWIVDEFGFLIDFGG